MSRNAAREDRPTDLVCPACNRQYGARSDAWRCDCGHALEFARRPLPDRPRPPFGDIDVRRGLWAFEEFLPIGSRVSLREGFTPLVEPASSGDRPPDSEHDPTDTLRVQYKLEYVFPTGSFKDRGASAIVSRAVELGADTVLEDSSGNAGAAIATYAARAGIDARIYVPDAVKPSKLSTIERVGAEVVRIPGSRSDVTTACVEAVEAGDGWYASHAWSPAFYAGTMTAALEIAAQRDWSVPDAVVVPIGHGTLFLGLYRGFERLVAAGWTDRVPRMLGAQAAGHAPVANRLRTVPEGTNDVADGIRIERPARLEAILEAIDATDGEAIAVTESEVTHHLEALGRDGFDVEPTAAVAPAALERYRQQGRLESGEEVVVPLTGSGLKT